METPEQSESSGFRESFTDALVLDIATAGLQVSQDVSLASLLTVAETVSLASEWCESELAAETAVNRMVAQVIEAMKSSTYGGSPVEELSLGCYWKELKYHVQRASDSVSFEIYMEVVRALTSGVVENLTAEERRFVTMFLAADEEEVSLEERIVESLLGVAESEDVAGDWGSDRNDDEDESASDPVGSVDFEHLDQSRMSLQGIVHVLEDAGVECIWADSSLSRLYSIDFKELWLPDEVFQLLQWLDNVQQIDTRSSSISDATIESLCHLAPLEWLCLRRTQVTDAALARLGMLSNLRYLDLTGVKLDGPGLLHLASLKRLEHLYVSDFQHNSEHIASLRIAMPGCVIHLN